MTESQPVTRRRQAGSRTPGDLVASPPFRLRTARDVIDLIQEQVAAVRTDPEAGTIEKARAIGSLAAVALRAIEAGTLADRLEALELALQSRQGDAR